MFDCYRSNFSSSQLPIETLFFSLDRLRPREGILMFICVILKKINRFLYSFLITACRTSNDMLEGEQLFMISLLAVSDRILRKVALVKGIYLKEYFF